MAIDQSQGTHIVDLRMSRPEDTEHGTRGNHLFIFPEVKELRLIEEHSFFQQPELHELLTRAIERGQRKLVYDLLADVIPGLTELMILTEGTQPIVHLVFDQYSVPVALAGDGIRSLLRLSLELIASESGVALLEEPEVHQHPRNLIQSAKAIWAAVQRGIQVIITTHSIELIDSLLSESPERELAKLSLYRLALQDGQLSNSRIGGPDIASAREDIQIDLR
ncbi:MAG: ATP-binding protein [Armatimonadetes bacterium]|nr:ATP-binding protein [Armatimonadota bacterium]